jgi:alkylhydroperoxidase/carboxymuconolactone decarboxylase family protein YurZ
MYKQIGGMVLSFMLIFSTVSEAQTMKNDALNARQQGIVEISAFTANGHLEKLRSALSEGLDAGLTVNEIKEILVQLYVYAGFPRSLNGLNTFMAVLDERRSKGIRDETGKEASPLPTDRNSLQFGMENQTKLAGQAVKGAIYDFAPAIDQFLKAHLFGDIFQRDNLDWQSRELATIVALASIEGLNPQLQAHYRLGMNTGLTPDQLRACVAVLDAKAGKKVGDNAKAVLDKVLSAETR